MGDLARHLVVFGKLRFPRAGVAAWRALPVRGRSVGRWPGLLEGGQMPDAGVAEVLDALAALRADQGEVEVVVKGENVAVHGFLLEPGTLAWSRDVAGAFRVAGEAGGKGVVHLVRVTGEEGAKIVVGEGAARFDSCGAEAAMELLASPAAAIALARYGAGAPKANVENGTQTSVVSRIRAALERAGVAGGAALASPERVEQAFIALTQSSPDRARPIGLEVLRARHDGAMAVFATALFSGTSLLDEVEVLVDYAAPAGRASPDSLRADSAMILRLPSLSTVLASARAEGAEAVITERLASLLERDDAVAGMQRLVSALAQRKGVPDDLARRLAERHPTAFAHLMPKKKARAPAKKG